ncbi:hypothetical protein Pmi06nite_31180 [Planotetraspora mira]|uniref:Uncharacterized protein n=1 Tax=Planotetraspora mira TaxID=58121 RepID=A0A8J3X6W4_9ACTN|nr:hypothetical protein Pmi06nite_31180 [Planotetraspora mira]
MKGRRGLRVALVVCSAVVAGILPRLALVGARGHAQYLLPLAQRDIKDRSTASMAKRTRSP